MQTIKIPLPAGGLDERPRPDAGNASAIVNMVHTQDGRWRAAPGDTELKASAVPVVTLGWADVSRNGPTLYVETGDPGVAGHLGRFVWADLTIELIKSDRVIIDGPGHKTSYVSASGWCYMFNGYNQPIRDNGKRAMPVGFDAPPPPPSVIGDILGSTDFATVDTLTGFPHLASPYQRGVGTLPTNGNTNWKKGYRVTWVNDLGQESPPSQPLWVLEQNQDAGAAGDDKKYKLSPTLISALAPTNVRVVRFWATANVSGISAPGGAGLPFYHLADVSPVEAIRFTDDHPDAELGALLDESTTGVFPPRVTTGVVFKGRMYFLADLIAGVYFSEALLFEQVPADNFLPVGQADGTAPTALFASRDVLLVFKPRSIWMISQTGTDAPVVAQLTADIGAASPAITEVPGAGVLFISDEGPYLLEGASQLSAPTTLRPLVSQIAQSWARMNRDMLAATVASTHRREQEVWFQLPAQGSVRPSLGLVYHYPSGRWSVREEYDIRCMVETKDSRAELFLGTSTGLSHVGRGYVQNRTVTYKVGPTYWKDRRQLLALGVWTFETGRHTADISRYEDRRIVAKSTQRVHTYNVENGTPVVWDTALWGTASWCDARPTLIRADSFGTRSNEYEFAIDADDVEISELEFQMEPSESDIQRLSGGS